MPFREKSAWLMILILSLGGLSCLYVAAVNGPQAEQWASPSLPVVVACVAGLIALAVIGHILIAAMAPREAGAPLDERERQIVSRAGHGAFFVLAGAVAGSLVLYLVSQDGDLFFWAILASLLLGQLTEYAAQVILYRTSV